MEKEEVAVGISWIASVPLETAAVVVTETTTGEEVGIAGIVVAVETGTTGTTGTETVMSAEEEIEKEIAEEEDREGPKARELPPQWAWSRS